MEINAQAELKANVEALATQENSTEVEIITKLQAAAAAKGNTTLLDALCELKWSYIDN